MIRTSERVAPIKGDVFIVEDDSILRPLLGDILNDISITSVAFTTAEDALAYALRSNRRCGLLIADHGLPGRIKGIELTGIFRKNWPDIPVIITSGYELKPTRLPEGVAYLQKPWSVDTLISTVADVTDPSKTIRGIQS
jgi:DNA-binding NtrC family response regulator